ncbi:YciI family protein [Brevibacterium atlanticum]|uniref:YciI family protein n=1 Tax=Brevibacterium atlanticum TaxID=2697563 RepID=UPI001423EEA9|nr:YciI family protein [Brevibacterium atlanticum]
MKYALLLMGRHDDPECGETGGADPSEFMAFDKEITEAGVVVGGFALDGPEFGVRVTESDGESIVTSGPFAESNEFVGGSYVIEVPDLDEAIAWAKKSPGARGGHIEIRPVADY